MSNPNDSTCPGCGRVENASAVMRDWIWIRQGPRGEWLCSTPCLAARWVTAADCEVKIRWLPAAEAVKRTGL